MDERIVDLSEAAAGLSVRNQQLVIKLGEREETVPIEDLAALIVSHPAVFYTQAVLSGICSNNGVFVICNEKRLPIGMLMPLVGNSIQTERMARQVEASVPVKKQLWKQIIQAKITAQASLLSHLINDDCGLSHLARNVRSGDTDNLEAQAARRYWPGLFGAEFYRKMFSDDAINVHLNYGYAVLRGLVARALVGTGLHPSIGLHHHNRYNAFCLADDLMEPFRPVVDASVHEIVCQFGSDAALEKNTKSILISDLLRVRFEIKGEGRTLFETLERAASSMCEVFAGRKKKMLLPRF